MSVPVPLLAVENLQIRVGVDGPLAVDDFSFTLAPGEIVALVGESGSGKTMAARAAIGLLPAPMQVCGGRITFQGEPLDSNNAKAMREVRGARIGMVFQEPMVSLNPALTIGRQMSEALKLHTTLDGATIRERCIAMLQRIGIKDAEKCLASYPHQFSGGMRQRIMLASVMLLRPALLIADEPTTALDCLAQLDDSLATYAHKLNKDEARIDWNRPAVELERLIRAFNPWPICHSTLNGEALKVLAASVADAQGPAGQILAASKEGLIDKAAELARLDKEIGRLQGEVQRVGGKLSNAAFVDKAPAEVIEKERAKLAEAEQALGKLAEQHARISSL